MIGSSVVIREIKKSDFIPARKLVTAGLLEHGNAIFNYTTLNSAYVQVSLMAL